MDCLDPRSPRAAELPPYPQAYPWVDVARYALIEAGRPDLAEGMYGRDMPACRFLGFEYCLPKADIELITKAMLLAHQSAGHDVERGKFGGLHCETCLPRSMFAKERCT